jgi:microcin C transport system substrate-binding protein
VIFTAKIRRMSASMLLLLGVVMASILGFAGSANAMPTGRWVSAVTLFGTAKYPPHFKHFDYVNATAPKGGTLRLAYLAAFDSLNPFILKGVAAPGMNTVFQTLMEASYDEPQTYYPLIAKRMKLDKKRRYMDVILNPKARFSDGRKVRATDVVFSLEMLKTKGHPAYQIYYKPVEKAVALGTHQVRFYFSQPKARELPVLVASLPVLPKHFFDSHEFQKTTLEPMIGSGPYIVSDIDPGRAITFTRNPDYWAKNLPSQRGRFNVDVIRYDVFRDDVVAVEAIKSGQIDYYEEYIARNFATAYNIPALKRGDLIKQRTAHKIPRGMQAFLFNVRKTKFSDTRVREAIGLAMDFEWMNARLFYDAYTRSDSFFQNTRFDARSTPSAQERKLLLPFKNTIPKSVFSKAFKVPKTDGSGYARANLLRAQKLLNEAGWVMRDGARINAKTGEALTLEFLMRQRTFERVVGIMRKNLKRLGIESSFRYVDDSQYQMRVNNRDFDMVSIWWNQGLHFPGAEQFAFWHSSQADIRGSQNLAGVKNDAVDALVTRIAHTQRLGELTPAARALDRVLLHEHYVIPHWHLNAWRKIYWNKFGRPKRIPAYNMGLDSWWLLPEFRNLETSANTAQSETKKGR